MPHQPVNTGPVSVARAQQATTTHTLLLAQRLRALTFVTPPQLRLDRAPEFEHWSRSGGILLLDQARIQAWQRLLFLQCGDGWIVEEAWRRARRGCAWGVDTAPELVARASALRGVPGTVEFKTWDGSRLPCPTGFFQTVLAIRPFDWCQTSADVFGEMNRVLQPGGDVYLLECDPSYGPVLTTLRDAGFREIGKLTRCEIALGGAQVAAAVIIHAQAVVPAIRPSSPSDRCNVA